MAGVGIEPPSPTTSSSALSCPDRSSTRASSSSTSRASGSNSSSVSRRAISSSRRSLRDRRGLGGERRGERVVQTLHVLVLLVLRHAGVFHALAQRLEQRRQAADHFGAFLARDLGARRPDQVGRSTLHRLGLFALHPLLHGRHRQHVGPDVEQELAHALLHRHLVEHLAQLDRVLDRQRFALLDLLRQRDALARGLVLVPEVVLEESLELGQHGLEDAPPGVGIGLDHLHDALDFPLQRVADGACRGVEAHHAGAHAVDQAARRVIDRGEEVGLAHRHAQHGHLQAGEPDTDRRRDAVFGQDALEQQRHDLDRRALDRRRRRLLERLLALLQFVQQRRRADRSGGAYARRASAAAGCPAVPR